MEKGEGNARSASEKTIYWVQTAILLETER